MSICPIPRDGFLDARLQRYTGLPAKASKQTYVEQLSWCAIWSGCVPLHPPTVTCGMCYHTGYFSNGVVRACPNIHLSRPIVVFQQMEARRCHVIDVKQFAARISTTPIRHRCVVRHRRIIEPLDESRKYVRMIRGKIVTFTIEISRHCRYPWKTVLAPHRLNL